MRALAILDTCLLDLLYQLRETDIRPIVGGGFGLYLKERHVRDRNARTLFSSVPPARSTNDIDLFLQTEVLADTTRVQTFAEALRFLGYEPVRAALYYQFVKRIAVAGQLRTVKIDLLTRNPGLREDLITDKRRVKPRRSVKLHAHRADEALAVEEQPVEITIAGQRSTGAAYAGQVLLPQPYAYAMLKLFAFRDQKDSTEKGSGKHHALDLYSIVAMITEEEYEAARSIGERFRSAPEVQEAAAIIKSHFSAPEKLGIVRLREHLETPRDINLQEFISILHDLFPPL